MRKNTKKNIRLRLVDFRGLPDIDIKFNNFDKMPEVYFISKGPRMRLGGNIAGLGITKHTVSLAPMQ